MVLSTFELLAEIGTVIVVFGVALEGAEIFIKIIEKRGARLWIKKEGSRRWLFLFIWIVRRIRPVMLWVEVIAIGIVIAGLAIEWFGTQGAERIQSTENSKLQFRAALLESNNIVLQKELQPRIITLAQITNFIFLTEKIPRVSIGIRIGDPKDETYNYAWQIRQMLKQAKFETPDSDTNFNEGIRTDLSITAYYKSLVNSSEKWSDLAFLYNSTNFLYGPMNDFGWESTNGLTRPIIPESEIGDTNRVFAAIAFCFSQIGITNTSPLYRTDLVAPGQFQIYVLQKP